MDLINLAKELGQALQNDEIYIKFKISEQNVMCDEALQKIISEFNSKKTEINEELSKENVSQEKIDELNTVISELYTQMMQNETMIVHNSAKSEFENILRQVNTIIMKSSQGEDPFTADFDEFSCGGGCGSCGGCH